MSSFRVNKETNEEGSKKYGPPLRDSDLQGPSPYSSFLTKIPPPDGDNKLVTANGNTLPYIAASYTITNGQVNDKPSYSIDYTGTLGTYGLNFIYNTNGTTLTTPLFGTSTTFNPPTLVVTSTTANLTASFTYDTTLKTFTITLKNSGGTGVNGNFNFIAFSSS